MTEKVLKKMPYAQARVRINPMGCTYLQSYDTIVAVIDELGCLVINGLYSMTTRRHIKAFCAEYCGFDDFALIKHLANHNLEYNIKTGEINELPNIDFGV